MKKKTKLGIFIPITVGAVAAATVLPIVLSKGCSNPSSPTDELSYTLSKTQPIAVGETLTITASATNYDDGEYEWVIPNQSVYEDLGLTFTIGGENNKQLSITNDSDEEEDIHLGQEQVNKITLKYKDAEKTISEVLTFLEQPTEITYSIWNEQYDQGNSSTYVGYGHKIRITPHISHKHDIITWYIPNEFDPKIGVYHDPGNAYIEIENKNWYAPGSQGDDFAISGIQIINNGVTINVTETIIMEAFVEPFANPQEIVVRNGASYITYEIGNEQDDITDQTLAGMLSADGTDGFEGIPVFYNDAYTTINVAREDLVGVAFAGELDATGKDDLYEIPDYFLKNCTNFNHQLIFPHSLYSIGDDFLMGCTSFNKALDFPVADTTKENEYPTQQIGDNFLKGCTSFNHTLDIPGEYKFIGNPAETFDDCDFLEGCTAFNSELKLCDALWVCTNGFLKGCTSFNQPVTMPLLGVGHSFLEGCTSFNQEIVFPTTEVDMGGGHYQAFAFIGNYFLNGCTSFNKPLYLPETIDDIGGEMSGIGYGFLHNCDSMTNIVDFGSLDAEWLADEESTAEIEVEDKFTNFSTVNAGADCYQKAIIIDGVNQADIRANNPNRQTSPYRDLQPLETAVIMLTDNTLVEIIDMTNQQLASKLCNLSDPSEKINGLVTPQGNINIRKDTIAGVKFLAGDDTLTTIGDGFCQNLSNLTNQITLPSTVTSIGVQFMMNCSSYNRSLALPEGIASIGTSFMQGCTSFNNTLTLPIALLTIGNHFMFGCSLFNQPLLLPGSLTSVGASFFVGCNNFASLIDMTGFASGANISGIFAADASDEALDSFCVNNDSVPCYTNGIRVKFAFQNNREAFVEYFPNKNVGPAYRKIVFEDCGRITGKLVGGSSSTYTIVDNDYYVANQLSNKSGDDPCTFHIAGGEAIEIEFVSISEVIFANDNTLVNVPNDFLDLSHITQALTLPTSVRKIGSDFMKDLKPGSNFELHLPDTIEEIGDYFLADDTNIATFNNGEQSFSFPASLTKLGDGAFSGCKSLNVNITLPEAITEIGGYFMMGCSAFTHNVYLTNCSNLQVVDHNGGLGGYAFSAMVNMTGVIDLTGVSPSHIADYSIRQMFMSHQQDVPYTGDGLMIKVSPDDLSDYSAKFENILSPDDQGWVRKIHWVTTWP